MAKGPWVLTARTCTTIRFQSTHVYMEACGGMPGSSSMACASSHASPLPLCRSLRPNTGQVGSVPILFAASLTRLEVPEGTSFCSLLRCIPLSTLHPRTSRPGHGHISSVKGRNCHSLSEGHVSCVQQKLLPAVGAHQLHCLLVQAHLPETIPSHAHGAWRLPGRRGSHGQTESRWGGRKPTLGSPRGKAPEAWDPGTS